MTEHQPDDETENPTTTRRRLVAAGAAGWATVSLSGCSRLLDPSSRDDGGNGGGNGDGNGGGNGDGNGGGQQTTVSGNTTVTNETTTTGDPNGEPPETTTSSGGGCSSIRRFASGMEVGLHVGIFDDASGDPLGDEAVEGVIVEFPDADFGSLELNWEGDHEAYDTSMWGGKVETSEDTESGTYRYEITVQKGDGESETVVDEFTVV